MSDENSSPTHFWGVSRFIVHHSVDFDVFSESLFVLANFLVHIEIDELGTIFIGKLDSDWQFSFIKEHPDPCEFDKFKLIKLVFQEVLDFLFIPHAFSIGWFQSHYHYFFDIYPLWRGVEFINFNRFHFVDYKQIRIDNLLAYFQKG